MADDQEDVELDTARAPMVDVTERVKQIQRQHRGRIRWRITKHTAELAIQALETDDGHAPVTHRSGKSRRRKRFKRLL